MCIWTERGGGGDCALFYLTLYRCYIVTVDVVLCHLVASVTANHDSLPHCTHCVVMLMWSSCDHGVQVLNERAKKEHLMDMLIMVNHLVATEFQSKGRQKQMPAPVSQLRKKLFFT